MISTQELRPNFEMAGKADMPVASGECSRQIVTAERELGAFLATVQTLHGKDLVMRAADDWIALVGSDQCPLVNGFPSWRQITIIASSHLATNYLGFKPQRGARRRNTDEE